MRKTVTFSFSSTKYEGIEVTETFTFEKLSIDENGMDDKDLRKALDDIFQA